jgi:CDP-2,3-bis-(O-geranylgeranyl)-sn-glycerol synthase
MTPVFARKTEFLNYPINTKLLGSNKTYRGFFFGILVSILTVLLQKYIYPIELFNQLSLLNYSEINFFIYGFLFGFGSLTGDSIKSYFKRKIGIKPGKPWIPFDQLDFIIGGLIFISLVYIPSIKVIIILLLFTPLLHVLTNYTGYLIGIREVKY